MRLLFYDFRHFFWKLLGYIFVVNTFLDNALLLQQFWKAEKKVLLPDGFPVRIRPMPIIFFYFLLFDINRRKQSYQTRFIKEQKSGFETVCIYLGKIALGKIGLFGALVGSFTKSRSQRTLEEGGISNGTYFFAIITVCKNHSKGLIQLFPFKFKYLKKYVIFLS